MDDDMRNLVLEAKLILETGLAVDFSEIDDMIDRLRAAGAVRDVEDAADNAFMDAQQDQDDRGGWASDDCDYDG